MVNRTYHTVHNEVTQGQNISLSPSREMAEWIFAGYLPENGVFL